MVMKSLIRGWSLAVVAAAMLATVSFAQQSATGVVNGSVRRASGPVSAAKVVVDSASDSKYTASTTTDADGKFTIADAPVGDVNVRVYQNDKVIVKATGTLKRAGETITLMLRAQ
jgi:hypothetical protein